jgi:hypothetical protein
MNPGGSGSVSVKPFTALLSLLEAVMVKEADWPAPTDVSPCFTTVKFWQSGKINDAWPKGPGGPGGVSLVLL